MSYCFDKTAVADFRALLACLMGKALRSPFRSTVPLLSLMEHSPSDWGALLQAWGAPAHVAVHVEYGVASPKPGGNPSQTDAMLIAEGAIGVWAVEAKWTEPLDMKTVAKRISKPESDGAVPKVTVEGWLEHIRPYATDALELGAFGGVVYQMLHRAASACAVASARGCRPQLVYLHFCPSPDRRSAATAQYVADLMHLRSLIGNAAGFPFRVVKMPLACTPASVAIQGLDKREPASVAQVKAALAGGPLFTFGMPVTKLLIDSFWVIDYNPYDQ